MDRIISAREANQHFSRLLRQVQSGETITVTSRGRPVARITGINAHTAAEREARKQRFVATLRARATMDIPEWSRDELYDR